MSTDLMAVKTTAVAPTLSAIDNTAIPVGRGARRKRRNASRTSWRVDIASHCSDGGDRRCCLTVVFSIGPRRYNSHQDGSCATTARQRPAKLDPERFIL